MGCGAAPRAVSAAVLPALGALGCALPWTLPPRHPDRMAEYTGPATDNEAVVIAQNEGHKVPDRYATGDSNDSTHGDDLKFTTPHAKRIHNDIYRRYGQDTPEDDAC